MAMVTLTSTNSNLTQKLSNTNLRDASFSSYLNSSEECFVRKLAESSRDINPVITKEDGEIGVFGAEKYFTGVIDHEESKAAPRIAKMMNPRKELQYTKDNDDDLDLDSAVRSRMQQQQPGTPSIRSESSCNTQRMLLNSIKKDASQTKSTKKVNGKSFLGGLICKCYCSDKNSIDIHEQVGEVSFSSKTASSLGTKTTIKSSSSPGTDVLQVKYKPHSDSWVKDKNVLNYMSFPALTSHDTGKNVHLKIPFEKENDQDMQQRKSLEVFGSPVYERRSKSLALDPYKRPTMLSSWDINPKMKAGAGHEISGGVYSDDCESDASSDLFEIDSLIGKGEPYLQKQVSDVTLSDCATPCYAPSEASIEWSVVTASAVDFSTVSASDYEDQASMPISSCNTFNKTFLSASHARTRGKKDGQRKGGTSTLLGCNSQKAVKVAGDHHEYSKKSHDPRMMHRRSDSFMPVSRFQAENSKKHFDTKHGQFSCVTFPSTRV